MACTVHALPGVPDLETSLEAARGWDGTKACQHARGLVHMPILSCGLFQSPRSSIHSLYHRAAI